MSAAPLKPCPFCGTPDPYFYDPNEWPLSRGQWIVECSNDDCAISVKRTEESEVIELWNTRPLTTTQSDLSVGSVPTLEEVARLIKNERMVSVTAYSHEKVAQKVIDLFTSHTENPNKI